MTVIEIYCAEKERIPEAQALAEKTGLMLNPEPDLENSYCLTLTEDRIELRAPSRLGFSPLDVSFNEGHAAHRLRFGGGRGQTIARACGLKSGNTPSILDLTAGLGRDAFVLASLGCQVTMIERNPVIATLLEDGLRRAAEDDEIGPWVSERITLIQASAPKWLATHKATADVVYLDPMFPERKKSAQVKKEMQIFHDVVGDDPDADALLPLALQAARQRVVVKRPRHAPPLANQAAPVTIDGKSIRYDIYPIT
jgi:16S rRNA (guanine1516-N2)-methyltransferase